MWEDAAANSAGGGGIAGIGVGASGEPGVHLKKKKKKEKELLLKMNKKNEKIGGNDSGDWEKRSRKQQDLRKQLWKKFGKKLSGK